MRLTLTLDLPHDPHCPGCGVRLAPHNATTDHGYLVCITCEQTRSYGWTRELDVIRHSTFGPSLFQTNRGIIAYTSPRVVHDTHPSSAIIALTARAVPTSS